MLRIRPILFQVYYKARPLEYMNVSDSLSMTRTVICNFMPSYLLVLMIHPIGVILSAFFYGYLVLQIPGGWLSLRIGAKRVLGYSILIASAIHTSLPIIVRYNCTLFVIARVIQGLALVSYLTPV